MRVKFYDVMITTQHFLAILEMGKGSSQVPTYKKNIVFLRL
jgi:hypothetical protein